MRCACGLWTISKVKFFRVSVQSVTIYSRTVHTHVRHTTTRESSIPLGLYDSPRGLEKLHHNTPPAAPRRIVSSRKLSALSCPGEAPPPPHLGIVGEGLPLTTPRTEPAVEGRALVGRLSGELGRAIVPGGAMGSSVSAWTAAASVAICSRCEALFGRCGMPMATIDMCAGGKCCRRAKGLSHLALAGRRTRLELLAPVSCMTA